MRDLSALGVGHDQRVARHHLEHAHQRPLGGDRQPGLIELFERQQLARFADGRSGGRMLAFQDHVGRPFAGLSQSRWSSMAVAPMPAPDGSAPVIW